MLVYLRIDIFINLYIQSPETCKSIRDLLKYEHFICVCNSRTFTGLSSHENQDTIFSRRISGESGDGRLLRKM